MVKVRKTPEGHVVPVLVTPGASREQLRGEHDGRLKVSVTAPPERGKANRALCALLAKKLGISRSQVRVVSGLATREKEVLFERVSQNALDGIIA